MRNITKSLLESLEDSSQDAEGLTIYQYAKLVCGGEMDIDVSDKEIDMSVAFCYTIGDTTGYEEMDRFLDILAKNVKIVKQVNSQYPFLICDFSSFFKPYNEQLKNFFNMEYSEFDEDEAYYEAVVNLEPMISGNCGEETYKEMNDILEGKVSTSSSSKSEEDKQQLKNNIEYIITGYENGMNNDPDNYKPLSSDRLIKYCLEQIFDIKDDGNGTTAIGDGICNYLKSLGDSYIKSEILRIGKEVGVLENSEQITEGENLESTTNEAAQYIFDDLSIDYLPSEIPDYEYFKDNIMDVPKRVFNKALELAKKAAEVRDEHGYFDRDGDRETFLELNDNHTIWELTNENKSMEEWWSIVDSKLAAFYAETGVEASLRGRMGRHVCVEATYDNCMNFDYLQEVQEKLEQEAINEFNTEEMNESNVDDALARMKQAREEILNLDKNNEVRKKQLINNIEDLVYMYDNGISDGTEEPFKSDSELIDYVYSLVFDQKSDGQGGTRYADGICRDLKYLGRDYIISEIKRIGHEAGVVEETMTESEELELDEYKKFKHINDVWNYLEASNSEEELKSRIADINPRKFGSFTYELHKDNNGALVINEFDDGDIEKVDIYFNKKLNESFDANEPNNMETIRDYVKNNPDGGSILFDSFYDGNYVYDLRIYPKGFSDEEEVEAVLEPYEVDEDEDGDEHFTALDDIDTLEGFNLNMTDEEVRALVNKYLGITLNESEEAVDGHLLKLLLMKKKMLTDDSIDEDTYYDLEEKIDNELINTYSIEDIEKAEKLVGLTESENYRLSQEDGLKMLKQQIKNPMYYYDNDVLEYSEDDGYHYNVEPYNTPDDYYDGVYKYVLNWKKITKKTSKEEIDKYVKAITELRDYAIKCKNNKAVSGINKLLNVKFSKFDTAGNEQKEKEQRKTTYYALYSTFSGYFDISKNWHWDKSDDETRSEFRERIKHQAESKRDIKIFDNVNSFLAACKRVNLHPDLRESTNVTAKVTYHDSDGTREYIAGKLSDNRYFLIGQQEQIVVSDKDLPTLAKKDIDNYSYDEDGDKEFIEALENGTTLDKKSDLAKIIINASRKYLDNGCYLLSEDIAIHLGLNNYKLAKFIEDSVEKLKTTDYTNCRYVLDDTFAMYVGWSDGYNANDELAIHNEKHPTSCLNVAIKVRNDSDWTDLDYLNFPYYENGDVFDTAITIEPNKNFNYYEGLAGYMMDYYEQIVNEYQEGKLLIEDVVIDNVLYIYSNAESEDKSDAISWADMYKKEFPNLKFRISSNGTMYFVDFIGKYRDICDALINLGWYTEEEINDLVDNDMIKVYKEV